MSIGRFIYKLYNFFSKGIYKFVIHPIYISRFTNKGNHVYISKGATIPYDNITFGNNVYIGPNALFLSKNAPIAIGNNVLFGPGVTIITGNHRSNIVGRTMYSIKEFEKELQDDMPVIIEDDTWISSNVTILKGVKIGTGSIIAAGSVVVKNVEKYSIVGGNPAKLIKMRFSESEIDIHEQILQKQMSKL